MTTATADPTSADPTGTDLAALARRALASCGVPDPASGDGMDRITARSPITGASLLTVPALDAAGVDAAVARAHAAFAEWRLVPAPRRGPATPAYRLGALMAREPWRLVPTDGSPSLRQALLLETAYGLMAMESPQRRERRFQRVRRPPDPVR